MGLLGTATWRIGSVTTAYYVLSQQLKPDETRNTGWAMFVSVAGYLVVPAVIGAVVGISIERRVVESNLSEAEYREIEAQALVPTADDDRQGAP